jgi:hypothetical protein
MRKYYNREELLKIPNNNPQIMPINNNDEGNDDEDDNDDNVDGDENDDGDEIIFYNYDRVQEIDDEVPQIDYVPDRNLPRRERVSRAIDKKFKKLLKRKKVLPKRFRE